VQGKATLCLKLEVSTGLCGTPWPNRNAWSTFDRERRKHASITTVHDLHAAQEGRSHEGFQHAMMAIHVASHTQSAQLTKEGQEYRFENKVEIAVTTAVR
jgi:hypothetical protein